MQKRINRSLFLKGMLFLTIVNFGIVFFKTDKQTFSAPKNLTLAYNENQFAKSTLEVNSLYTDTDWNVKVGDKDFSNAVTVNTSGLKTNHLNTYYVSYTVALGQYRTEQKFKEIEMVDTKAPTITLKGLSVMKISLGTEYREPGYEAIDNFDGDVTSSVQVKGSVNYNQEGTYLLTYIAADKRGNTNEKQRTVIVGKENDAREGEDSESFDPTPYSNTITSMQWTEDGITVTGYVKNSKQKYTFILDGPILKKFEMKAVGKNNYKGTIPLENLPNGVYEVQIEAKKKEDVLMKLKEEERLVRAHLGNKLITFSYHKDKVTFKVEKFKYQYDIVIDPGHGGSDTGTVVDGISEQQINLEQSLYEKKRYEEHGLKVKLLREDNSYGEMLGNAEWKAITKRAYTVGYYGSVAKYTYSNHHNAIDDPNFMGWEILVPASLGTQELEVPFQIVDAWMQLYPLTENHIRMYARNYETGGIYNKINGQTYGFKDYYAVNRISLSTFHVLAPIYEGSYMSNVDDFTWYYREKNYKKLSEAKIKIYVEACGLTYKKPS